MSYFRHPKTTNERKQWAKVEHDRKEYGFKIRARAARNERNLPDTWDDLHKSFGWEVKSWKHYRRSKQWDRRDIN